MKPRIVAVTPAGRRHYLELLRHYVCADDSIEEWHLWDNCRNDFDRKYIGQLGRMEKKVRVIRLENTDGTNRSVNRFYRLCAEDGAFYIKLDDDIVYLPKGFAGDLHRQATEERERFLWWSPLVINNAICSWLLKHHSSIRIQENLTCQAGDHHGWFDPSFAERMHQAFLEALHAGDISSFYVPNFQVSLARFSINCLGFFGADVRALGTTFCPLDVDDEDWISAGLPSRLQRPGRIVGNLVVAHFSFHTQEPELLQSRMLDRYYEAAGLRPASYAIKKRPLGERAILRIKRLRSEFRDRFTAAPPKETIRDTDEKAFLQLSRRKETLEMANRDPQEITELLKPVNLDPLPENPLVTLLTPNYNYARYVAEAIESALSQTYQNLEMIVCDDGSTDDSCEVIERYAGRDPRIRLIRQKNGGVASALNAAYRTGQGEIVCLLDADDRFLPEKLERVVEAFRARPESGFLGHPMFRTDSSGRRLGVSPWIVAPPDGWQGPFIVRHGDAPPGQAFGSGICFRKTIGDSIFPLQTKLRTGVDGILMVLAPLMTPMIGLPVPLAEYRCHQANLTNTVQLTSESLEREWEVGRTLWAIRKKYLEGVDPRLAAILPSFDRGLSAASYNYTQARLRRSGSALRAYRNLVRSDQFPLLHAGLRWFLRMSILLPLPVFRYGLNLTSRPNRLKQWLWWLFKYAPGEVQRRLFFEAKDAVRSEFQ